MDNDDLPPPPRRLRESLGGEIGSTVGRFLWILLPVAIIAALFYLAVSVFGR
ncbi:MAG TPA: hypothetical protein VGM36_00105 [Rhizomicrobium sp.]|jgi:hypothetical protein